jgi:hypothetical protein
MRKYLFNPKTVTTAFGAIGLARSTAKGPRDWRTALLWVVWLSTLAIAIGDVREKAEQSAQEEAEYDATVARGRRRRRSS